MVGLQEHCESGRKDKVKKQRELQWGHSETNMDIYKLNVICADLLAFIIVVTTTTTMMMIISSIISFLKQPEDYCCYMLRLILGVE